MRIYNNNLNKNNKILIIGGAVLLSSILIATALIIRKKRFKNSRKNFYRNSKSISLQVGDVVVAEETSGYDIGVISIVGELARIQVKKKETNFKPLEAKKIHRIATQEDIDKWIKARSLESGLMQRSRTMAIELALEMKISDVEYESIKVSNEENDKVLQLK